MFCILFVHSFAVILAPESVHTLQHTRLRPIRAVDSSDKVIRSIHILHIFLFLLDYQFNFSEQKDNNENEPSQMKKQRLEKCIMFKYEYYVWAFILTLFSTMHSLKVCV